jgi:hypothetical protein
MEKPEYLYTVILRCYTCLRELTRTKHVEKKPGVMINYTPCPIHKNGVTIDWEPEDGRLGTEHPL